MSEEPTQILIKGQAPPDNNRDLEINLPNTVQNSNHLILRPILALPIARPFRSASSWCMPTPILQNIVSTCNLGCNLDLRRIAMNCRNVEYNPKRFAAAIMRIRDPKTTAMIFASGKMICLGAKSEELSKEAAKRYAQAIKKVGFSVSMQNFKI